MILRRLGAFFGVSRDVKNIGEEKNADPLTYLLAIKVKRELYRVCKLAFGGPHIVMM